MQNSRPVVYFILVLVRVLSFLFLFLLWQGKPKVNSKFALVLGVWQYVSGGSLYYSHIKYSNPLQIVLQINKSQALLSSAAQGTWFPRFCSPHGSENTWCKSRYCDDTVSMLARPHKLVRLPPLPWKIHIILFLTLSQRDEALFNSGINIILIHHRD